jgi:hypothetical protein
MCPGTGEEAGCLLHLSAKDQTRGLRNPRSCRILSHLDTCTFKSGQTTLWGHSRLQKGPSKLGTWPRKGFPGNKETVNQHPCTKVARCNMVIWSLHLWEKSDSSEGPYPNGGSIAAASGLPVKALGPSNLRVAPMFPGPGCCSNPNQGVRQALVTCPWDRMLMLRSLMQLWL